MKRKDILIIAIVLVVIAFGTAFAIYYAINGDNIFSKVKEEITEIAETKKEYHKNGWETAIVEEIKYDVPIPVGFTYVEGKKETGIIIKNNATEEKYMWIPYEETNAIEYEEAIKLGLETSTYEEKENIQKYNGFYVAIDERSVEERFEEYIKENAKDFNTYYELKSLGYEKYKELYHNITNEEFSLNKIDTSDYNINEIDNESKTKSVETHTITIDELLIIRNYEEKIGNEINIKDLKTLTVLGSVYVDTENTKNEEIDDNICEKVKDKNGEVVYIPKGFAHVNGTTVDTGFKIRNTDNLVFIWIPVENIEKVEDEFIEKAKEANIGDSIIKAYETYEDNESSEEYKELIKSIKTYGGFYISEAELGYDENGNVINRFRSMIEKWGEGTGYNYVSNGDYFRNVDPNNYAKEGTALREKQSTYKLTYESAEKTCKELYSDSEVAVSHLTYGIEYDAVVNFLINRGAIDIKTAFKDSTKVGKYQETNGNKSLWEKEYYLNGIYGLAGNLEEITREKDGDKIVLRGGSWYTEGTSKPLAGKVALEESKIDKGQDENGNEKTLGSVGFRACLYIKTEYKENTELETKKQNAVESLKTYINNTTVKNGEKNYFNNAKKEGTDEYQVEALNSILKYTEERLQNETSSAGFGKIVQYGKDQVDSLRENIELILEYPKGIEGYTYGEISQECWNIKEQAVEEMEKLTWNNGVLQNEQGIQTTYQNIRRDKEEQIEIKRNEYRTAKSTEYIDNYPTAAGKNYAETIKTKAKEELKYTEDLANLPNIAVKYQSIIEVANTFENTAPNSWDYYDSWKVEYGSLKEEYLNKIAKEAKTKEEAESLAKEGMEKINTKSAEVIKQKQEEEKKAENRKYIFAGDSRFVHMQYVKEGTQDTFICKSSMGYDYFVGRMEDIKRAETDNSVLIIGFGINDLWNADKYIQYVNGLNLKSEVYFLTVNPVDEAKERQHGYAVKTSKIIEFNDKIKANAKNYKVLDTYEYLMKNGFETSDGVHYTNNTSKAIYKYIKEQT